MKKRCSKRNQTLTGITALSLLIPIFLVGQNFDDDQDLVPEEERLQNLWEIDNTNESVVPKLWEPSSPVPTPEKPDFEKEPSQNYPRENTRPLGTSNKTIKSSSDILFPLSDIQTKPFVKSQLRSALEEKTDDISDTTVSDVNLNINLDLEAEIVSKSIRPSNDEGRGGGSSAIIDPSSAHSSQSSHLGQVGAVTSALIDTAQTSEADIQPDTLHIFRDKAAEEEAKLYKRIIREKGMAPAQQAAPSSASSATQVPTGSRSVISSGQLQRQHDLETSELLINSLFDSKHAQQTQKEIDSHTQLGFPKSDNSIAQTTPAKKGLSSEETNQIAENENQQRKILVNFNDVSIIEYLRFISRYTNKNFIFDEEDLQFNVTIISEEPTTIENILTALVQELRIHDLVLIEQGNNLIIHKNANVNSISKIVSDDFPDDTPGDTELVTQVFRLNTLDPDKAADIVRPLVSESSIVEPLKATNHIIITDIATNVSKIAKLLKSLDSPNNGLVVGQYVVKNAFLDTIVGMAQQIMEPLSQDQKIIFVSHSGANSVFIVSTPFLVERTIAVLNRLDQTQGITGIYDLKQLEIEKLRSGFLEEGDAKGVSTPKGGSWEIDENGNWKFIPPAGEFDPNKPPKGGWDIAPDGNWNYDENAQGNDGPEGRWKLDPKGIWIFQLNQGESITPEVITRKRREAEGLPIGSIERTKFYIHKLQFRSGSNISDAILRIGDSMAQGENANYALLGALQSVQWLETSNSLVFTGEEDALQKVKELVEEIDTPLRQVFIEMLILQTTITDSLTYGVNFATRFANGDTVGAQAFLDGGSPLFTLFPSSVGAATETNNALLQPSGLISDPGYTLGIIGETISRNGEEFASIAALVKALHSDQRVQVVLNPKIITEDNQPAEIFVGENRPFQSQAISNDEGSVITQNVEFRDIGTRLRVTPLLGNSDIITLIIDQELSGTASGGSQDGTVTPGTLQTTTKATTTTRVHIPDGYFLVISGLLKDRDERNNNGVPCLGGAPILGALFKSQRDQREKNNIMTFIRPKIIDTDEEIQNLTRHQQDIYRLKNKMPPAWKYETEKALEFLNIKKICDCDCSDCKYQYEEDWFEN